MAAASLPYGWLRDANTGQFINAITSKRFKLGAAPPVRRADAGLPKLPMGWACNIDEEDCAAWYNNVFTSSTQWERPTERGDTGLPPLPPGWSMEFDSTDNLPYYVSPAGASQWERPPSLPDAGSPSSE
jgi:hypothetical protein